MGAVMYAAANSADTKIGLACPFSFASRFESIEGQQGTQNLHIVVPASRRGIEFSVKLHIHLRGRELLP